MSLPHSPQEILEGFSIREDRETNIAVYFSYLYRGICAGDGVMSAWKPMKSMSWSSFYPLRNASVCGLDYGKGFGTLAHVRTLLHLRKKLADWHEWTFDYTSQDLNILPGRGSHLKRMGIEVGRRDYSFPEVLESAIQYAKTKGYAFTDAAQT